MRILKIKNRYFNWRSYAPLVAIVLVLATTLAAFARQPVEYSDVHIGAEKVFNVTNTALMSASERSEGINDRLSRVVANPNTDVNKLEIRTGIDGVPVIVLGNMAICHVTAHDAASCGQAQQSLAQQWRDKLRSAIMQAQSAQAKQILAGNGPRQKNSDLSEHAVLLLFLEIALLLLASLIFGELFVRLGQPAIIGQIVAGLVLGQTFFGTLLPDFSSILFPQGGSQSKLIEVVSWIGVSFLLMLTGMDIDTSMLKRLGKPALYVAILGVLGPLTIGGAISLLLPAQLITNPHEKLAFAVFLGTLFASSSVLVVATILTEMKLVKRDIGQLVLSAALSHELLCCLLLAVIAVLAGSGAQSGNPLLTSIAGAVCFVLVMYFGRPLFFAILRWVNDKVSTRYGLITAMIVLLLSCAAATEAAGIHIVLGAFAAGIILSQAPVINRKVVHPLETVTMGFFAPIFFASAGLNVNLTTLLSPQLATITILLTIAAIASKIASCYVAGKLTGLGRWQSLSMGVGSNARGSMGLILAMLGYSLNIITTDMFSIVIFVALVSTALAPPLMKWTMARISITEEEKARMDKEERCSRTIFGTIRRVLWPTSGKGRNRFMAKLLESIGERQVIEATALWVKPSHAVIAENPLMWVSDAINRKHVGLLKRTVRSENVIETIAEESNRGYDLLLMNTDKPAADANYVFGKTVDGVILNTTTRVLVVYEPENRKEQEIKKVLVAVSGTELSVSAGELGISLAKSLNAKLICLCLEDSELQGLYSDKTRSGEKIEHKITDEIEGTLAELSRAMDVDFEAVLMQSGSHPAEAIIMAAERNNVDLIVLGGEPKLGKGLFLGHTINFVLRHAPCTIAVLKLQG